MKVTTAVTAAGFFLVLSLVPAQLYASTEGELTGGSKGVYTTGPDDSDPAAGPRPQGSPEHFKSGEVHETSSKELDSIQQGRRRGLPTRVSRGRLSRVKLNKALRTTPKLLAAVTLVAVVMWRLTSTLLACLERYREQRSVGSSSRSLSSTGGDSDVCESVGLGRSGGGGVGAALLEVVTSRGGAAVTEPEKRNRFGLEMTKEDRRLFLATAALILVCVVVTIALLVYVYSHPAATPIVAANSTAIPSTTANSTVS